MPAQIETLLAEILHPSGLVAATDAHPATLDWLCSVLSHNHP